MLKTLSYLTNDKGLKFAFWSNFAILGVQLLLIVISYKTLPPIIPLYLQRPWGLAQVTGKIYLFLIPGLVLGLAVLNTFLSLYFYSESPLVSRILLWGQLLFSCLTTIAMLKIIFLVI